MRLLLTPLTIAGFASLCFAQTADAIYHNGPILTMNDAAPRAQAVAVRDGRILAVGTEQDVLGTRGESTEVIDLQGRTMLPGFVDAHGHVMAGGLQALSANLLAPPDGEITDIASLQETLRAWMDASPDLADELQLVVGFGYDNAQLAELRHPDRDDLDAVSATLPVLVIHQSGHLIAVNSKALEVGGISSDTPDPAGGVIQRRQGGREPNGVLEESAAFPLLLKLLGRAGPESSAAFVRAGTKLWSRFGYTTAPDGRSTPDAVATFQRWRLPVSSRSTWCPTRTS